MEHVFKDLLTKCWWSWLSLLIAVIAFVLCVGNGMSGVGKAVAATVSYFALCGFFVYPLFKAAYGRKKSIITVCLWSFVLLVLWLVVFHYNYYAWMPSVGVSPDSYSKILNLVPVMVAIWAAGLGWFVHFKLSTLAHRTNNSFAMTMETTRSTEFLKRQEIVSKHFPPGTQEIPKEYHAYFKGSALRDALNAQPRVQDDIHRAQAMHALKHMLNFYEFMAVGIKMGDLDEELLYQTNCVQVVNLFTRAKSYVDYVVMDAPAGAGQPLAFCELRSLVERWRRRIQVDTAKR